MCENVMGVLGQSMRQVAIGVLIGTLIVGVLSRPLGLNGSLTKLFVQALVIGAGMAFVGVLATIAPAWRVLRVPPSEAFRA